MMKVNINNNLLYFDVENPELIYQENKMKALPTMIVLHGGPGYDHTPYQSFFSELREVVQIIYLDQHGNGRSDPGSPASWNFERWAGDINAFCKLLHIQRPIIFGHSFGSMVALEYAIRYPDQLKKLILCNVIPQFDIESSAETFYQLGGEKAKQAFLNFCLHGNDESKNQYGIYCAPYYSVQKIDEQSIFYNRLKLKMDILEYFFKHILNHFNCLERIKSIQVPTLILTGEKDPIALIKSANLIAERLGEHCYRHIIVPSTSHNLIWEKTELVMRYIKEFIEEKEC
jgi:proline-specific peptidase